jgi:prevent-host-death family protein
MRHIGIRELKNRLSHYVRLARAGQEILVTDRGEGVAELVPPQRRKRGRELRQRLSELARRGLATVGAPQDPALYRRFRRIAPPGTARRLLDEERDGR